LFQKHPRRKNPKKGPRRSWDFTFTSADADLLTKAVEGRFREIAVRLKAGRELRKMVDEKRTSLQKGEAIAYTGGDHTVVEEYDDRHPFLLPLRVDVRLSALEAALNKVFFDPFPHVLPGGSQGEGNVFSRNIVEFVRRMQEKRKDILRDLRKEFSEKQVFDALSVLFFKTMTGARLLKVITPESRKKWEMTNSREVLRPTPGLAAKVSRRLFLRCFDIRFEEQTLRQKFTLLLKKYPA